MVVSPTTDSEKGVKGEELKFFGLKVRWTGYLRHCHALLLGQILLSAVCTTEPAGPVPIARTPFRKVLSGKVPPRAIKQTHTCMKLTKMAAPGLWSQLGKI